MAGESVGSLQPCFVRWGARSDDGLVVQFAGNCAGRTCQMNGGSPYCV